MIKRFKYILFIGLSILIVPYLLLSLYTFPQGDDFYLLSVGRSLGIFGIIKEMYLNWSGRYFAIFMGAINPGSYIYTLRISIVIFQLFFIYSLFNLINSLINKVSKLFLINVSLIIYLVFINILPFLFEFNYWYPSVVAYQFGLSWLMLLWSFLLKKSNYNKLYYYSSITLISVIIIGTNELLIAPFFITILLFFSNKENRKGVHFYLYSSIVAFAIITNIFARGNFIRYPNLNSSFNIINILINTVKTELFIIISFIQNGAFLIFSIILLGTLGKSIISKGLIVVKAPKIHPLKYFIIANITFIIIISPSTIILGHVPAGRIINLYSFFFYTLWIIGIINFVNYHDSLRNFGISKKQLFALSMIGILFLFNGVFVTDRYEFYFGDKKKAVFIYGNSLKINYTLLMEAKKFSNEIQERDSLFQNAYNNHKNTIKVPALKNHPKLLLYDKFYNNQIKGEWYRDEQTNYYYLDSIFIEP